MCAGAGVAVDVSCAARSAVSTISASSGLTVTGEPALGQMALRDLRRDAAAMISKMPSTRRLVTPSGSVQLPMSSV